MLANELGLKPMAETCALYGEICKVRTSVEPAPAQPRAHAMAH